VSRASTTTANPGAAIAFGTALAAGLVGASACAGGHAEDRSETPAPAAAPKLLATAAAPISGDPPKPTRDFVSECNQGVPIPDLPPDVLTTTGNVVTWKNLRCAMGSPNGTPRGDPAAAAAAIDWVPIPAGTYRLGSTRRDFSADGFLLPYEAEVDGRLEVAATETTNHQYRLFYGSDWPADDDFPVMRVNFYQARAFCAAVGGRLPSEAEWEIAARAGTTTEWWFGESPEGLHRYAWYGQHPARSPFPVGRLEPNPWGVHDLHGNVWEWTEGCFDRDGPGPDTATGATAAELKLHEGERCHRRALRGGSFLDEDLALRSPHRAPYPALMRCGTIGFRCVRGAGGA